MKNKISPVSVSRCLPQGSSALVDVGNLKQNIVDYSI